MSVTEHPWELANQAFLRSELARIRARIEGRDEPPAAALETMEYPPALHRLAELFGLTPFERDLVLLCAGVELEAHFAAACRDRHGPSAPTFGLALEFLPDPHWSALAPTAPLRYWKLVEVLAGDGLLTSPLRVDERILHYLAGISYQDERLHGLMQLRVEPADLPATHRVAAVRIASLWGELDEHWGPVQLCGDDESGLQDVAAAACAERRLSLHVLRSGEVPQAAADRELMARLWDREAVLGAHGLLLVLDESDTAEARRAAAAFVERVQSALLIASREPLRLPDRTLPRVDVRKPGSDEQGELWRQLLRGHASDLNGQIERLVNQFDMGRAAIETASAMVLRSSEEDTAAALWETCRAQSRARLDDLAQRVETDASWDDLVLPELQLQILRDVVTHVRHRVTVYDEWGFRAAGGRGLGVSALFSGPSGTGKTLAAEILANELRLDLYRIDLSQVVSKYIGETEKNLHRVFDAAETAGAVLLFDEADALFGKRSEVKDSHDRYANIEVSYLLQRMEAYRGLAILTTNMKHALDPAFTRRIRFIAQFPFPEAAERAEIWRRIFPLATPTDGLDVELLARLNVAGGNIRNIALGAAFLAADDGGPVRMSHVLRAARAEYAKLDRPLTGSEVAGWPS